MLWFGWFSSSLADAHFASHGSDITSAHFSKSVGDKVQFHLEDYLQNEVVLSFGRRLRMGRILYIHIGMVCSSFSMLRIRSGTSSLSKQNPWRTEAFIGEAEGNRSVQNFSRIIDVCNEVGIFGQLKTT